MTGTGTQADPYCPTTLSELISVIRASNVYVKLTQDIDANDDPTYDTELNTYLDIECTLYSEEGHRYAIKNVCVNAQYAIYGYFARITNVDFKNFIHRKKYDTWSLYFKSSYINNCKFSLNMICSTYNENLAGVENGYFKNCAFNAHFESSASASSPSKYYSIIYGYNGGNQHFQNCNFIFDNLFINTSSTSFSDYIINNSNIIDHCMFLFDKPRIAYNNNYYIINMNYNPIKSCYFAFHQPVYEQTGSSGLIFKFSDHAQSQNNLFARDPETSSNISIVGHATLITLDQLKNQAYLKSIGFLP